MGILIDSSVLIGVERSGLNFETAIRGKEDEQAFLSVISASELLHGVHRAKDARTRSRRLAFVEGVLAVVPIIEVDLQVARLHAQVWGDLEGRGEMIGLHDSWLAATALAHDLTVATGNIREFKRISGLRVMHWRG